MKKLYVILAIIIFASIIFVPPITKDYDYPVLGQDAAWHLMVFDNIKIGQPIPTCMDVTGEVRYFSYYIVGYPLDLIHNITGITKNTLFLWFNFASLFVMGVSLLFIFSKLFNIYIGILALVIPIFTSFSTLLLYYSGAIFDVINIGIILPFICYFVVKALFTGKKLHWICSIILGLVFVSFHSTGVYLPFIIIAGVVAYVAYKKITKQKINKWFLISSAISTLLIGALFIVSNKQLTDLGFSLNNDGYYGIPLLWKTLSYYMSVTLLAVIIISLVFLVSRRKQVTKNEWLMLLVFSLPPIMMLPEIVFGISPQPFRQGLDCAIMLSMVSIILIGIVIKLDKSHFIAVVTLILVVYGSFSNISNWVTGYNSALEKIDMEAIEYVNNLDIGNDYSASMNIDHVIYGRFINKQYTPVNGGILIMRNKAMTSSGVMPEKDIEIPAGMSVIKVFVDGWTEIKVYSYR
jgi:hypothetical protein